ncbi:MAG: hypothetical protein HPY90_09375 [Syntrophothermus sp.]|uniref:hypothetical protein n=1 Tax=Syntrophothermus sp. TaxID=2736299 RepID=UPI00257BF468|nr:hypothetical protein [Syntrophothermus sp.]NSW83471.1 hypothetical protein [Syntrophothermus sp.]
MSREKAFQALISELTCALERLAPRFQAKVRGVDILYIEHYHELIPTALSVKVVSNNGYFGSAAIGLSQAAGLNLDIIAAFLLGAGLADADKYQEREY